MVYHRDQRCNYPFKIYGAAAMVRTNIDMRFVVIYTRERSRVLLK
jgi:hypothetical protein